MSGEIPRLRMFAGPNGSGKSTLKTVLPLELLGVYLNPDAIELEMRTKGFLDLHEYSLAITEPEAKAFFHSSVFLSDESFRGFTESVSVSEGRLYFDRNAVNSYVASAMADLFRQRLMATGTTFTLETVMSHPSKVELLKRSIGRAGVGDENEPDAGLVQTRGLEPDSPLFCSTHPPPSPASNPPSPQLAI